MEYADSIVAEIEKKERLLSKRKPKLKKVENRPSGRKLKGFANAYQTALEMWRSEIPEETYEPS